MSDLAELLARLEACDATDNALDVAIEVATFEPDDLYASVRPNNAGTKVIYTKNSGEKQTCWAMDWTLNGSNRKAAAGMIRRLQAKP